MPEGIAFILPLVRILLGYGRHLADTLQHRAVLRTFSVIAQCFGTRRLSYIGVRVARGIRRAIALERVLLARARRGRDLVYHDPDAYRPRKPRPPAQPLANGQKPPGRRSLPRPDPDEFLDLDNLPSIETLEKEIRRRGIGRALAAICRDLGVRPALCHGVFGTDLWQAITWYGSKTIYAKYYKQVLKHELDFANELDRERKFDLEWPNTDRDHVQDVLGFFIGEQPVWPDSLPRVAQAATGPP